MLCLHYEFRRQQFFLWFLELWRLLRASLIQQNSRARPSSMKKPCGSSIGRSIGSERTLWCIIQEQFQNRLDAVAAVLGPGVKGITAGKRSKEKSSSGFYCTSIQKDAVSTQYHGYVKRCANEPKYIISALTCSTFVLSRARHSKTHGFAMTKVPMCCGIVQRIHLVLISMLHGYGRELFKLNVG